MEELIYLDSVVPAETKWLWYPYVPLGKITVLQGDPGEGKSTLALNLAAAVTRGVAFTTREAVSAPDYVLYQNAEDGLNDTVRPRLDRAGADASMIMTIDESHEPLSLTDPRLHTTILRHRPKLVIIDPLQGYLGDDIDMHRANEIRPVMSMLAATAEASGAAILLIGHMNKVTFSPKAIYRGLGSIDIAASARSVLLMAKDPAHPENRVLMQIKNSLAPLGKPLGFSISEAGILDCLGECNLTEQELLSNSTDSKPTEADRAKRLILAWMQNEPAPHYAKDIYEIAEGEGISKNALMRAKDALNIQSKREGSAWVWYQFCSVITQQAASRI